MGGGGTFSLPFIKCEQSSSRTQFPILKIWKFLPKSDCRASCCRAVYYQRQHTQTFLAYLLSAPTVATATSPLSFRNVIWVIQPGPYPGPELKNLG